MNKAKKNIVIVGFSDIEKNSLGIPYIEKGQVHYVKTIKEAIKYQGYMLIIDNKDNIDITILDKKYRKSFNKFDIIWLYNENYEYYKNKWSRIEKVNRNIFYDNSYILSEEYDDYKLAKEKEIKTQYNLKKNNKLNKLYNYLKNYKTIKTIKIEEDLKINARTIERYMEDLNQIYHNIGYDYTNNEWYFKW